MSINITVCASGGGGNFQALINAQDMVGFRVEKLITDRVCGAIERAINYDIRCEIVQNDANRNDFCKVLDSKISPQTDLIVFAGFFPIVDSWFCKKWNKKIINTHPSLLPKYGGMGMYGIKVQEAVILNKEEFAGCSVHYVNDVVDGGDVILQKAIKVKKNETAQELSGRVFSEENILLVRAVKLFTQGCKCEIGTVPR